MWWFVPGVLLAGWLVYKWLMEELEEARYREDRDKGTRWMP